MPRPVLLTVDDDAEVLRAIERDLRSRYVDRYRVMRANSGGTALKTLRELKARNNPVALLLADQRVPQMDGSELNQVWTNLIDNAADAMEESGNSPFVLFARMTICSSKLPTMVQESRPRCNRASSNRFLRPRASAKVLALVLTSCSASSRRCAG